MAGHLEENQPQVLTSPDNKSQTLHHMMSVNRFGHRVIESVVRNNGSDPHVDVAIKAGYYDTTRTLIGTEMDIIRQLGPRKTGAFKAVCSGERHWDIKYYRILNLQQI